MPLAQHPHPTPLKFRPRDKGHELSSNPQQVGKNEQADSPKKTEQYGCSKLHREFSHKKGLPRAIRFGNPRNASGIGAVPRIRPRKNDLRENERRS
jgi:hypothetical protein